MISQETMFKNRPESENKNYRQNESSVVYFGYILFLAFSDVIFSAFFQGLTKGKMEKTIEKGLQKHVIAHVVEKIPPNFRKFQDIFPNLYIYINFYSKYAKNALNSTK